MLTRGQFGPDQAVGTVALITGCKAAVSSKRVVVGIYTSMRHAELRRKSHFFLTDDRHICDFDVTSHRVAWFYSTNQKFYGSWSNIQYMLVARLTQTWLFQR